MAYGVEFGGQNDILGPPKGMTEDEVYSLHIQRYVDRATGTPCILSAWRFSDEEMEEFKRTGIIYYSHFGQNYSPMFLTSIYPEGNILCNIYVVRTDEELLKMAKEIDDDEARFNDLTEIERLDIDMKKRAAQSYINWKRNNF